MCQCVRALHRCADGRLPMPLGAHWDLQKREERKKGLDKSGHIEGPLLGLPRGRLALGKQPSEEEETFYVATDVKLFLSSLRAGRSLLLSIPNDLSGLRLC
jgi:hypothetical protein